MPDLPPLDRLDPDAPLQGLAVLEVSGEFSGYAGRLLADLGADVTRVTPAERTPGPPGPSSTPRGGSCTAPNVELALDPGTPKAALRSRR